MTTIENQRHQLSNHRVIARSAATWQSVLFPVPSGDRSMRNIAGDADCHVACRLLAMTW